MLEYQVVTQEERKNAWASVKKCDRCQKRLPTSGHILLSLTQLGPRGYCTVCGTKEIASSISILANMMLEIQRK